MSLVRPRSHTTQDFRYERIRDRKNGIRLARIRPGAGRTRVAIDLVESWLSSSSAQRTHDEYAALSYTWGDGARTKTIHCNDRTLAVTENLLQALLRFRDPDNTVTLWIDQICIWQDNLQERNSQVSMMNRIYMGARKVLVWLGDHDGDSKLGMQLADQLRRLCASDYGKIDPSLLDTPGLPRRGDRKWRALAAILDRPWFSRTWVIQEVCMNPAVELVLGGNTLHWNDLETIVGLLDGPPSAHWDHDPSTSAWELPFSRINRIRKRHLQTTASVDVNTMTTMPEYSFSRDQTIDIDLLDLLLMSRHLDATDPQDKLFALLGLSNHDLEPDYGCSPEHIFTEFAIHIVGEVTENAIPTRDSYKISSAAKEARQALTLLSCAGYHNRKSSLHSWIPDWTTDLLSRPLIFDSRFCAGGDELEIDWKVDTGLLQLYGKLLDTVSIAGNVRLRASTSGDARAVIDHWWSEATQIANARIVQSPGSAARVDAFRDLQRDLGLCRHGYYKGEPTSSSTSTDQPKPRRRRSLIDEHDLAEDLDDPHNARLTLTLGPTRGRVFFSTSNGYIGLAPHGTIEGDLVYIIIGSSVPFVVRPTLDGVFTLIGEAYVQGIMRGEALQMDDWTAPHAIYLW